MLNWLDYALIVIILFSAVVSIVRGFIREVLSIVVWILAFWIAWHFSSELAAILGEYIKNAALRYPVAFLSLFVATMFLGGLVNYLLAQLIDKSGLSGTDRALGLVFGIIRGVLIIGIFLLLARLTPLPEQELWKSSRLVPVFSSVERWLQKFLPSNVQSNFILQNNI